VKIGGSGWELVADGIMHILCLEHLIWFLTEGFLSAFGIKGIRFSHFVVINLFVLENIKALQYTLSTTGVSMLHGVRI
jgi:hypothetical protein